MASGWAVKLDRRIAELTRLRDQLAGCIGCGCLSIDRCALHNPDDRVARYGAGPVLLREAGAAPGGSGGVDEGEAEHDRAWHDLPA